VRDPAVPEEEKREVPRSAVRANPEAQPASHWNSVARTWSAGNHENPILAAHKRRVYTDLVAGWTGGRVPALALKTDLFAEAFNDEEFVSSLGWQQSLVGIDISTGVLDAARHRASLGGLHGYVACDVRRLPFASGTFDAVVSDSTLDHLSSEAEIVTALGEAERVLKAGGMLIVTIDNPSNMTYPPRWLVLLWMRLGLAPYYIGVTLSRRRLLAALQALGMEIRGCTAILHYPHPDGVVRAMERAARRAGRGRLDRAVARLFAQFERLEHSRLRYLSGRYLAVAAVKGVRP
jgi:SAM-dependent methyltransferase